MSYPEDLAQIRDLIPDDAGYLPSFINNSAPEDATFMALVESVINQPLEMSPTKKRKRGRPRKNINPNTNQMNTTLESAKSCVPIISHKSQIGCGISSATGVISHDASGASCSKNVNPVERPQKVRRRRRKVSSNDAIDDLPADISMNFSRWFYGDLSQFRPESKQKPEEFKSIVDRFIEKQVNFTYEPENYKYLTEDLSTSDLLPMEMITTYNLNLREHTKVDSESAERSGSCASASNGTSDSPHPKRKRLSLSLTPQRILIDRRPMLRRLAQSASVGVDDSGQRRNSLIDPAEDCDGSDNDIPEIDCDDEPLKAIATAQGES